MLVAGAGAGITFTIGGAFTFNVDGLPSASWLSYGSAFIYIMLFAGASAANTSSGCGAFTFDVEDSPLWADWYFGSAY